MAHPVISVDVMGGDHGPDVILDGIEKALVHRSDVRFLLFGNGEIVRPVLARKHAVEAASMLVLSSSMPTMLIGSAPLVAHTAYRA